MLHHRLRISSGKSLDRGIFGGGEVPGGITVRIGYISISTTGNAVDFGWLSIGRSLLTATSNEVRGVFGGGEDDEGVKYNTIEYITISTTGDAVDFGDLMAKKCRLAATSNGTANRGVFGGGYNSFYAQLNVIDYITISTTGNAVDFGDLTATRERLAATSNGIANRGVFGGGYASTYINVIDYITISTTGNAVDFGDLTATREYLAATSNGIANRGVFGGGYNSASGYTNVIDYITISTTGNAVDFGDLFTEGRAGHAATSGN